MLAKRIASNLTHSRRRFTDWRVSDVTDLTCTCPSGDGSLRWPCPQHPPVTNLTALDALMESRAIALYGDDPLDAPWSCIRTDVKLSYRFQAHVEAIETLRTELTELTEAREAIARVSALEAFVAEVRVLADGWNPKGEHLVRELDRALETLDGGAS